MSATPKSFAPDRRRPLGLPRWTVDVWITRHDEAPPPAWFEPMLSDDERARANRFRTQVLRERYVVGRGLLRTLIGRYTGAAPASIRLRENAFGKPSLVAGSPRSALRFNVSHSGDLVAFAFSDEAEVGIDVERIRAGLGATRLAEDFFSNDEVVALRALPLDEQDATFFRCWTRKEAYVKARGLGLSVDLSAFSVLRPPWDAYAAEPPALVGEAPGWRLVDFAPAPGYAGALAIEARDDAEGRGLARICMRLRRLR
jgi:4'-phosphopantetheinyl transferase